MFFFRRREKDEKKKKKRKRTSGTKRKSSKAGKSKAGRPSGKKKAAKKRGSRKTSAAEKRGGAKKRKAAPKRTTASKTAKTLKTKKAPRSSRRGGEGEEYVGKIIHYFGHVKAGVVAMEKGTLKKGDLVHIKGHTTDFKERVKSIQIDRVPVESVTRGREAGIRVRSRVRLNDRVYRIVK